MASISGVSTSDINGIDGFFTTQGGGVASTTPTISVEGGVFGEISVTVTNASSYTNPNYSAQAKIGSTVTVLDSAVVRELDSSGNHIGSLLTFVDSNASTSQRTVSVKAQEFGDFIQSAAATGTYTPSNIQNRYLRVRGVTSAGAETNERIAILNVRFYTGAAGTGTEYPTANLTSNTSNTGIEVSAGQIFSQTYAPWKACDNPALNTWYWALGTNAANNWWQIHWESGTYSNKPIIKSMIIKFATFGDASFFKLQGSDTGSFSGEETDYGVFSIIANTVQTFG